MTEPEFEPGQFGSQSHYQTSCHQLPFLRKILEPLPWPLCVFTFYITVCDTFQILQKTPGCVFQCGLIWRGGKQGCGEGEIEVQITSPTASLAHLVSETTIPMRLLGKEKTGKGLVCPLPSGSCSFFNVVFLFCFIFKHKSGG